MSYAQEASPTAAPPGPVPEPLANPDHGRRIARRRVGRPPIEESIELLMPSQFHPPASEVWWPGEKRLMLAVLADAIDVLVAGPGVNGPRRRHLYEETAAWFRSNDADWPYSFFNICDALELDVWSVRNALVRRCERARARRSRGGLR